MEHISNIIPSILKEARKKEEDKKRLEKEIDSDLHLDFIKEQRRENPNDVWFWESNE
tara:strand:+ start:538 stop:708 length:171 start_codon:yes stop_codon:yes gene_type:complete